MTYNYYEAVKNDLRFFMEDNAYRYDINGYLENDDLEGLIDEIECDVWVDDSVTGNASGSYTFNRWEAHENLNGNMELYKEACYDFGIDLDTIYEHLDDAEYMDVTIRCWVLSQVLKETIEEELKGED